MILFTVSVFAIKSIEWCSAINIPHEVRYHLITRAFIEISPDDVNNIVMQVLQSSLTCHATFGDRAIQQLFKLGKLHLFYQNKHSLKNIMSCFCNIYYSYCLIWFNIKTLLNLMYTFSFWAVVWCNSCQISSMASRF